MAPVSYHLRLSAIRYSIIVIALCTVMGCHSDDELDFLERIAHYQRYEAAEAALAKKSLIIDSVFLSPYNAEIYTDRVYPFSLDTFTGTLLLEFDESSIVRCELVFSNPSAWLLPVGNRYRSSLPNKQLFKALCEYCTRHWGKPMSGGETFSDAWWTTSFLLFRPADSLIVLNIIPTREEVIPWYLRHSRLHSFNPFKLVSPEDSDAEEHSLSRYSAYLFGSDTNFGMPGLTQTVYTSKYDFALNLWSSIIGIPRSLVDTAFNAARSKLGKPLEATSNTMTWDLQKYYYRLMRLDSFTVQSATVPKLGRTPEAAFRILNDSGLELSMIGPDSTIDRMEREASPSHDPRSVRLRDERFFHPLWKLRHANKSL